MAACASIGHRHLGSGFQSTHHCLVTRHGAWLCPHGWCYLIGLETMFGHPTQPQDKHVLQDKVRQTLGPGLPEGQTQFVSLVRLRECSIFVPAPHHLCPVEFDNVTACFRWASSAGKYFTLFGPVRGCLDWTVF